MLTLFTASALISDDIWAALVGAIVTALLPFIGYLGARVTRARKTDNALRDGLSILLAIRISESYQTHMADGWIPHETKHNLSVAGEVFQTLGGTGAPILQLAELENLPTQPQE